MPLITYAGTLLRVGEALASDIDCCCDPPAGECCDTILASWTVTASSGETGCCSILEGTYTPDVTSSGCVYRRTVTFAESDLCDISDVDNCYLQYYTISGTNFVTVTNVLSVVFQITLSDGSGNVPAGQLVAVDIRGTYRRSTINLATNECFVENSGNPQNWEATFDTPNQFAECLEPITFGMGPSFFDIINNITTTFCSVGTLTLAFTPV